ncbi:hypothetical protein mvi_45670 [Methylobacterium indicum]|uniref:Uncharacterized protein n=1 Tax=Methylobacterium indicum TaxID=1775910 RepID=A0A8H9C8N9_9HYPH|nr:hypothetical protein mvi_45670 [Methylobacterium indicum]
MSGDPSQAPARCELSRSSQEPRNNEGPPAHRRALKGRVHVPGYGWLSRGAMVMAVSAPCRIQPALEPLPLSQVVRWSFLVTGIGMCRVRAATLRIHGYLLEFDSMKTMLPLLGGMVKGDS